MNGGQLTNFLPDKVLAVLRDGRHLVGTLRSFDQHSNIILENTVERRNVGDECLDLPLGLFILRGDSIVMIGSLNETKEQQLLKFVPVERMKELVKEDEQQLAAIKERDWNFDKW